MSGSVAERGVARDWLTGARSELAVARILDVAERLFVEQGVHAVTMRAVADAVGCSRATLYRYFAGKDDLMVAYVERSARDLADDIGSARADSGRARSGRDTARAAIMTAVDGVRRNPALSAWFDPDTAGHAGRIALLSPVIERIATDFLASADGVTPDPAEVALRARWLVRVIVSLLTTPSSAEDERDMLDRFVIPVILGG